MIYSQKLETDDNLYLSLIRNVKNVPEVKTKVLSGDLRCSLIKPRLIVDPFQIVVAANKACVSQRAGKMITKTVYTEILFNLSISKNITQSLMKFGVHEEDKDLIVAVIGSQDDFEKVLKSVNGQESDISGLSSICSVEEIRKIYNFKENESEVSSICDSVVSRIAAKHCLS